MGEVPQEEGPLFVSVDRGLLIFMQSLLFWWWNISSLHCVCVTLVRLSRCCSLCIFSYKKSVLYRGPRPRVFVSINVCMCVCVHICLCF